MKKLVVIMLVVLALVSTYGSVANAVEPQFTGLLGARMFADGGVITATIGVYFAGYNSPVTLYTYDGITLTSIGFIGMSQSTGTTFTTAPNSIAAGTEIIVGINVNNWGTNYYSGNGTPALSTDGNLHAKVDFVGLAANDVFSPPVALPVLVGFEDLRIPGSDADFNDVTVVSLKGVHAVPEASTLIGFGSALVMAGPGMIGWLRRRRS